LNGPQLFESMYAEDSDGQKINKLPAAEELLLSYPLYCKIKINVIIALFSASHSISIASGALMVQNIRVPHLSVRKSKLWQNG